MLLWEDLFFLVSLPPSLSLFWMSPLPCFPRQQVQESTLSHTLGELHVRAPSPSCSILLIPRSSSKIPALLTLLHCCFTGLPGRTTTLRRTALRRNTCLKRYVTNNLSFCSCLKCIGIGCFNCSGC